MPSSLIIKKGQFNDPSQFFSAFLAQVDYSLGKGITKYVKKVKKEVRRRLDTNDVPGVFSEGWKATKASLGLRTEHLQRLGSGDSRSYYENVEVVKSKSGRFWFVGILKGTPAFQLAIRDSGLVLKRDGSRSLAEVAEDLETGAIGLGPKPMWGEIAAQTPNALLRDFHSELVSEMSRLGAGDAR